MEFRGGVVRQPRFTGIRNRRSRNRRPALACAAAVLVAGLGAVVTYGPAENPSTGGHHAQVHYDADSAWHMPAE